MIKEEYIIHHLIKDNKFFSKAFTTIQPDFFQDVVAKKIFKKFKYLVETKFGNCRPSEQDLLAILSDAGNKKDYEELNAFFEKSKNIDTTKNIDMWIDETENWAKGESTRVSLEKSIELYEKSNKNIDELLKIKAIFDENAKLSFKKTIGMSLRETINERFDNYEEENKIRTFFPPIDDMLLGGMNKHYLLLFLAPTNVGKTYLMNFLATEMFKNGYNVLFISHEENQEKGFSRTDANLLETPVVDFKEIGKENWIQKMKDVVASLPSAENDLIIKSYPNKTCSNLTIKNLIDELKTQKNWVPDVIFTDYLTIMKSSRVPDSSESHTFIKSVAEELRALSEELGVPVVSAGQQNRGGMSAGADADLTHSADGMGGAMTADAVIALHDLGADPSVINVEGVTGIMLMKLLKTRNGGNKGEICKVGTNVSLQKLYDLSGEDLAVSLIEEANNFNLKKENIQKVDKFLDL